MKFFNWMQSKLNGGQANKRPDAVPSTNHTKKEPPKEEFSDWPHGLLAIGTFGNTDLKDKQEIITQAQAESDHHQENDQIPQEDELCSSPDFSEFTAEEVGKLQKELKRLINRKPQASAAPSKAQEKEQPIAELPLDRFLNCPSSLEVDRNSSNRFSVYSDDKDEEEIDRTIRIILGRCKDVCEKKKKKDIGKKSLTFLVKKMFACRGGFVPTPNLRDSLQESRMEKLLRTMLTRKIYSQNSSSRGPSSKKYIEDSRHRPNVDDESQDKNREGSKWDKTDSEYIVLEI